MKQPLSVGVCCLLLFTVAATAQSAKPKDEHPSMAQVLDGAAGNVRTFAQQVKHVAAVNYILGAAILQEKPPAEVGGESRPESITAKADILKYLKASFEYAHKAIGTINEKTYLEPLKSPFGEGSMPRLAMGVTITSHGFDHYGQNSGVLAKQWDRTAGKPVISPFTPARRSWLRAV